jgi:serine/threonine protein kinase
VALHSAGIVHRDLKPDNIVVNARGHVVLAGFDYAKVLGIGSGAHIQGTTTLSNTTVYQAPEMHLGWVHDFAVDCWAFGILLYVMLFGRV